MRDSVQVPIAVFDAALQSIADTPKLDSLVITKMFLGRSSNLHLSSTTIDDPSVKVGGRGGGWGAEGGGWGGGGEEKEEEEDSRI